MGRKNPSVKENLYYNKLPNLAAKDKELIKKYENEFTVNPPGRSFYERIKSRVSITSTQPSGGFNRFQSLDVRHFEISTGASGVSTVPSRMRHFSTIWSSLLCFMPYVT
jgi:hypothetical protein